MLGQATFAKLRDLANSCAVIDLSLNDIVEVLTAHYVTMFYKIINDIVSIDFSHHLKPSSSAARGHCQRFIPISTRVNSHHHSFLPSVVRMWNSLPIEVVMLMTLRLNYYAHAHKKPTACMHTIEIAECFKFLNMCKMMMNRL